MNVFWGDDEKSELGNVREGIDFVALADAESTTTQEKKRNVGAEAGGNLEKTGGIDLFAGELEVAEKGGRSVAGTSAKATASGNALPQEDLDAGAGLEFAAESIDRAIDEIFLDGFAGKLLVSENLEIDGRGLRGAKMQGVMEGNGVKDGAEFVVTVGAFSEDVETQIHFGERWDSNFSHAVYVRVWRRRRESSAPRGASPG